MHTADSVSDTKPCLAHAALVTMTADWPTSFTDTTSLLADARQDMRTHSAGPDREILQHQTRRLASVCNKGLAFVR